MRTCSLHPHCLMLSTYWTDSANQICHLERPGGNPTGAEALSSPEESRSGTARGWLRTQQQTSQRHQVQAAYIDYAGRCELYVLTCFVLFLGKLPTANGGRSHRRLPGGMTNSQEGNSFPLPVQVWKPGALPDVPPCYQPVYQWHSSH